MATGGSSAAAPYSKGLVFGLSLMMFLQFFIWGAWFPQVFAFLKLQGYSDAEKEWILNAFAIASFTGLFFSTQFADRNFAAEKFMAFSHLVGGAAILGLAFVNDFWSFFLLMLVHSLFYVPTISISNSIAFTHLRDAQREFGLVRLWGTIGWIVASLPFVFILADWAKVPAFGSVPLFDWLGTALGTPLEGEGLRQGVKYTFVTAGIAELLLAAFSLTLPHTPPKPAGEAREALAWLEAIKLLRYPFLAVLFVVTFIDACVHQCYFLLTVDFLKYVGVPANWAPTAMTVGQVAEIFTMAVLGWCLAKMGWKTTLIVGVLGHVLRFGVFSLIPPPWVAVTINVLHGICYAFFFATVYIFIDEFFPKDVRNSAQGLFNFLILGLGPFVGNLVWPRLESMYKTSDGIDYRQLFLVPAGTGLVAALILLFFFWPPKKAGASPEP